MPHTRYWFGGIPPTTPIEFQQNHVEATLARSERIDAAIQAATIKIQLDMERDDANEPRETTV